MNNDDNTIDVYSLLSNITHAYEEKQTNEHILSNLNMEDFIKVSENKSLKLEGESDDMLVLSKNDGWLNSNQTNESGYTVLNNSYDSDVELLIKGIDIDIY